MNLLTKRTENFPQVKSFFSDFFETPLEKFFDTSLWNNKWFKEIPAANIWSNDKEYSIEVAAPGMIRDDFKVTVENGMLSISAEKEESKDETKKDYTRKEYNFNSFSRSFYLPDAVNTDKIDAKYENGVLKLTLPKKEEARKNGVKQVKIS